MDPVCVLGLSIWKLHKGCSQRNILKLIMHLYEVFKCYLVSQVLNECLHFISVFTEHKPQQNGIFQAARSDSEGEKCNTMTKKQSSLQFPFLLWFPDVLFAKEKKIVYYMQTNKIAVSGFFFMILFEHLALKNTSDYRGVVRRQQIV